MKRTVLRSKGTVVPPDVTHATWHDVCVLTNSRILVASAVDMHVRATIRFRMILGRLFLHII